MFCLIFLFLCYSCFFSPLLFFFCGVVFWVCVCVCFFVCLFECCGLCLWFCIRPHINLTLPCLFFWYCFGFCLFLLGLCFGFWCNTPTRPTNKQEEKNAIKNLFRSWVHLGWWSGRRKANEKNPEILLSFSFFPSLSLSSFCFSSLLFLLFLFLFPLSGFLVLKC